ncbi:MAG: SRPBCC family protein [Rhodoglobus sp.]
MTELGTARATSTASPTAFFARWTDHDTWPQWSPSVDWVTITGPVVQRAQGVLKPRGGPATKFIISALITDREYTDTSRLPGATLVFQHLVHEVDGGSELEVRVTMSGPMSWLWARILGRGFTKSAPEDLGRLIALVESQR